MRQRPFDPATGGSLLVDPEVPGAPAVVIDIGFGPGPANTPGWWFTFEGCASTGPYKAPLEALSYATLRAVELAKHPNKRRSRR